MEQIEETIIKIIKEKYPPKEVALIYNSNLKNDVGLDSIDILKFALDVEKHYQSINFYFYIDDNEIKQWKTIQDIVNTVKKGMN
jgi:acyl carrier protein